MLYTLFDMEGIRKSNYNFEKDCLLQDNRFREGNEFQIPRNEPEFQCGFQII